MYFPSSAVRRVFSSSGQGSKPPLAGTLIQKDARGNTISKRSVYANKELIIGRDRTKCQWMIDDPQVSRKHLRIYAVVYDAENSSEIDILVYAEDLSQNGSFWNGSFIGKGNGGFLLSQDDCLKLSQNVFLFFRSHRNLENATCFDLVQEKEMNAFRSSYVLTDRLLGSGAFGRVFMAIEMKSRSQLACKMVDLRKLKPSNFIGRKEEPSAAEDVDDRVQLRKVKDWAAKMKLGNQLEDKLKVYHREVEILASISHDLVTAGDLFSYIESKTGRLLEVEAAVIIRQVLIALCFLHKNNIVHRDLKPDNVLMTSLSAGCRIVLTDFGAARRIKYPTSRMSSIAGTDEYAAPEVFGKNKTSRRLAGYTMAVDLWSLGCLTVVLLTGGSAFNDPQTNNYSEKLANECNLEFLCKSPEWQEVRPRPAAFVEKLLVLREDQRMTAPEALEHEWFSNETHKTNFHELYERTIKHWRPRPSNKNVIEFQDAWDIQAMDSLQHFIFDKKPRRFLNDPIALDAHLKPFPKKMFQALQPPRKHRNRLSSPEVQAAIEEHWSDLSSDAGRSKKSKTTPGKIANAKPQIDSIKPLPEGSMNGLSRNRTISVTPLKPPDSSRRTSFREQADSVQRNSSGATTAETPQAKAEAPLSRSPAIPQVYSSYFEAAVAIRPASTSNEYGNLPWSPQPRNGTAQSISQNAKASQERLNEALHNQPPMSDRGDPAGDFKTDVPSHDCSPTTPRVLHKLRRLSTNIFSARLSSYSRKRSRRSVFDLDNDSDDEMELKVSPYAAKRAKIDSADIDLHHNGAGSQTRSQDGEVTLPHHINAFCHLDMNDGQDIYLPR